MSTIVDEMTISIDSEQAAGSSVDDKALEKELKAQRNWRAAGWFLFASAFSIFAVLTADLLFI